MPKSEWLANAQAKIKLRDDLTKQINKLYVDLKKTEFDPLEFDSDGKKCYLWGDGSISVGQGGPPAPPLFTKDQSIKFSKWVLGLWDLHV